MKVLLSLLCFVLFSTRGETLTVRKDGVSQFVVTEYGAIGNGENLCTRAIQKAIDECELNGGGRVYVPPGRYLTGSLILKSGVGLYLERNSVLYGSGDLSSYPAGVLISARNAENVSIEGRGEINGNGRRFWKSDSLPLKRPHGLIRFEDCRNVVLKGVKLHNSPKFTLYLENCSLVQIDEIEIENTLDSPNTDGIDVTNSSNVFISKSFIMTGDDGICLKSNRLDRNVENVVVSNCIIISDDTALKLGTGSKNTISDCIFTNIVIPEATNGVGLFMNDGGVFERLQFSNINMVTRVAPQKRYFPADGGAEYWRNVLEKRESFPIFIDSDSRTGEGPAGVIQDVTFRDIVMDVKDGNCLISGRKDRHLENITMDGIRMDVISERDFRGRKKPRGSHEMKGTGLQDFASVPSFFTFAYVDGLTLRGISIRRFQPRGVVPMNCIFAKGVSRARMSGVDISETEKDTLAVVKLVESRDILLTDSPLPGTRTALVEVDTGTSRHKVIEGDPFGNVRVK